MLFHHYLSTLVLAGVVYATQGSITDYAPLVNQLCPNVQTDPLLRVFTPMNQSLHPDEEGYVNKRLTTVIPNEWKNWLGNGSAIGYDLSAFDCSSFPKIGIAISGGGYRAAQFGAGVISALDARDRSAKAAGTGGSWLTGSLYMNDFPTIKDLVFGNGDNMHGWLLDLPLATPDGADVSSKNNQEWYDSILGSDELILQLPPLTAYLFQRHEHNRCLVAHDILSLLEPDTVQTSSRMTLPTARVSYGPELAARRLNLTTITPASTVYEMTPIEFGSWDPQLSAMVNMAYGGTHLTNGQPDNDTACTTSFDQTGFIMGTSSSLFNELYDPIHNVIYGFDNSSTELIQLILKRQLAKFPTRAVDVANWPNDVNSTWLNLIDGGSNQEIVPLGQQFVRARGLDVIVAVDASSDTPTNWPNGSSLIMSASRITNLLQSSHQSFPPLPSNTTQFISTGVSMRPTFFGCFPRQNPPEYPIVVYLPNSPPLNGDNPVTNTSDAQLNYTQELTRQFLDQAHANVIGGFIPNTDSPDPEFGKCMQCVAIDRARYQVKPPLERSSICTRCFQQYCFNPNNQRAPRSCLVSSGWLTQSLKESQSDGTLREQGASTKVNDPDMCRELVNDTRVCTRNFTTLFIILYGFDNSSTELIQLILKRQLAKFPTRAIDVANWPNPFYNLDAKPSFQDVNSTWLNLIDGGSNQEIVPLGQQFVRARGLDVVVAVDASSDTPTNWPK
ncbi:acyl transferase/acyl hydrolase/lysophospholipase [Russula vinacea]|nr:acyl transferase/acyl hydrolase/lysophospholipase [Russula vinacea]